MLVWDALRSIHAQGCHPILGPVLSSAIFLHQNRVVYFLNFGAELKKIFSLLLPKTTAQLLTSAVDIDLDIGENCLGCGLLCIAVFILEAV